MTDLLIAIMAVATVVLGGLAYVKFQRATGGTPDTDKIGKRGSPPLPSELRELQIEQPQENMLNHSEEPKRKSHGQENSSGHSTS